MLSNSVNNEPTPIVSQISQSATIRPARSLSDLISAFSVIYTKYEQEKYISKKELPIHCNAYNLFPSTETGVIESDGRIVGTGSVVKFSDIGLPSYSIFKNEYDSFLARGRRIAEGTLFAHSSSGSNTAILLACYGINFCLKSNITDFFVTINPAHLAFWKSYLGFRTVSEVKECSHVKSAPGILMHLPLEENLPSRILNMLKTYAPYCKESMETFKLKRVDVINLIRMKPEVWLHLESDKRACLNNTFPGIESDIEEALLLNSFNFGKAA